MLLLTATRGSGWITLDLSGLVSMLACFALAAGFAVAGIVFVAALGFAKTHAARLRQKPRIAASFSFALGFALLLPVVLQGFDKAGRESIDLAAVVWAPLLAVLAGLVVRAAGRSSEPPS